MERNRVDSLTTAVLAAVPNCNASSHDAFDPSIVTPGIHERTLQPPASGVFHLVSIILSLTLPFFGLVAAMWLSWKNGWFDWTQLFILYATYAIAGLGITVGFHRMLTHRSFETYPVIRAFWMIIGALAVQNSPIAWCATHRKHHALSDKPGDPHSPHENKQGFLNSLKGFWHAHAGWLMTGHIFTTDHIRYVPDLLQDPLAVWIHRTWDYLWFPLAFLIPTAVSWAVTGTGHGALMGFLWGGCARIFLVQHMTFSVNSICHLFGKQDYRSMDESRNNLICGIVTGGEGFHNNHHAFPTSARHGLEWWQLDLSWWMIRLMEVTGLAWNVKLPSAELLASKRLRSS